MTDSLDIWHIVTSEGTKGPYSASMIADWLKQGNITATTLVWREGFKEWQPLSATTELSLSTAGTVPPPATTSASSGLSLKNKPSTVQQESSAGIANIEQADENMAECPNCKKMVHLGVPICPHCTYSKEKGKQLNNKINFANMEKAAKVEKDLIKWAWPLIGFGPLNFFSAYMYPTSIWTIIIQVFAAGQIIAGIITLIVFKRQMYILIILMTFALAILNGLSGAIGLAGVQLVYAGGLVKRFIQTRPS